MRRLLLLLLALPVFAVLLAGPAAAAPVVSTSNGTATGASDCDVSECYGTFTLVGSFGNADEMVENVTAVLQWRGDDFYDAWPGRIDSDQFSGTCLVEDDIVGRRVTCRTNLGGRYPERLNFQ